MTHQLRTPLLITGACALFLLLTTGCAPTGAMLPEDLPPGFSGLYQWHDSSRSEDALEQLAAQSDHYSQALTLLHQLRRTPDAAQAEKYRKSLHELGQMLADEIAIRPHAFNTFVLAELCSEPASGLFDRQLAAALYSYSAERGFPPAAYQLGKQLVYGSGVRQNWDLAESLLHYALDRQVRPAAYLLYELYTLRQDPRAGSMLLKAAGNGDPEAAAISQLQQNPALQNRLAGTSACAAWSCAMQENIYTPQRIGFLLQALQNGHRRAPAALAFFYQEKPSVQALMAINAAILYVNTSGGSAEAYDLLAELDDQHHLALAALVICQRNLQTPCDFMSCTLDLDSALVNLRNHIPEHQQAAYNALLKALQRDPARFYLSGIVFRLKFYGMSVEEITALLDQTPPEFKNTIPAVTTALLFAAENGLYQQQAKLSLQLLELVKTLPPLTPHVNLRRQVMGKIPGAALLPPPEQQLCDPEIMLGASWNLAVDLHVAALLAQNKTESAQEFLLQLHRYRLPPAVAAMERNLIKRFAPQLLKK